MNRLRLILAALVVAINAVTASANITVKVMKGGVAPYLYAWDSSENPLNGAWPGTQFTEKDADGYWTTTITTTLTEINMIMNMGGDAHKTGNYLNIPGVDGVIKVLYDGNNTMFGTMPEYAYSANKVYFMAPKTWGSNIYVHAWGNNDNDNGWPGQQMSKIGTDGMGLDIYEMDLSNWGTAPLYVQFNNNSNQTGTLNYQPGGYYYLYFPVATFYSLSAANGFTDDKFRAGIAAQLDINDGDVFTPSSVTKLDVSGREITSLAGINQFAMLIDLNASNNSLTWANLQNNLNLEILDLSHNSGLESSYTNASQVTQGSKHIYIKDCTNMQELYLNDCNFNAIGVGTFQNLKKLDISNNTPLTSISSISNCTNLETLILNGDVKLQEATTSVLPISNLSNLKHVEFNNVDLSTNRFIGTESTDGLLTSSRNSLEYLDISNDLCVTPDVYGYTKLKTLKINGNYNITSLKVDNCTALQEVDVTGNTKMTHLTMNNDNLSNDVMPTLTGLTSCTMLSALDLNNNQFTSVPQLELPMSCASLYLNNNQLTSITMPAGSPVQFLYAENNGFSGALELTAESTGSLKGLDLGNNGITSFKAEGTTLSALMIGNNPSMTTLELHGNNNLTCTTAGTTMSDGSGLYLLGNNSLETIDLSNSSFTGIGQNGSLASLSNVKTLNGSHNAFTLFSNGTAIPATSSYTYYDAAQGHNVTVSIPAVAAHTNLPNLDALTGLEFLDMSYNQIDSIHLYKQVGLKYLNLSNNGYDRGADTRTANPNQQQVYRKGLMKFDAHNLTALEYLNVSDCRIQETAIDRISETTPIDGNNLSGGFVWIKHCQNLKEFYADNNGMRSFGIKDNPNLKKVSARYMYGQSPEMMQGSINIHDTGVDGGSNLEYYDVSYSMFDSIGVSVASKLKVLKVEGNPIHYLNLNKNKDLEELYAAGCTIDKRNGYTTVIDNTISSPLSGLLQIRAQNLGKLTLLNITGNDELKNLYCENDAILPEITGIEDCTDLRVLHAYNDVLLGQNDFNVNNNTALTTLWVSNCSLPDELKVSQCADMDTLRCNDNQLTKLDVATLENMHWLDCYNNTGITTLVPGTSIGMTHLDLHNCSVYDLYLANNTAMKYMDCDNNHVRELNFTGATGIETIHANNNNLFQIKMGNSHATLADMQFANNHINGINLSGCNSSVLTTLDDSNNGRTITANHNCIKIDENTQKHLYFFQLVNSVNEQYYIDSCFCVEDGDIYGRHVLPVNSTGTEKSLLNDGFDLTKVTWNEPPFVGTRPLRARVDEYNLDPERVQGTIVVLENTSNDPSIASGKETYQYDNGIGTSTFYLKWTALPDVITEVEELTSAELVIVGSSGCIIITASHAMPVVVTDVNGRIINQCDVDAGTTTIDGLVPGIYIVNHNKVIVR